MHSPERDLIDTACHLVERLKALGADTAEATASSGWELSARIRLGDVELLEEAGHKHVSIRVIQDNRVSLTSTSDLTKEGLDRCVQDAMELLKLSQPDPDAAPADTNLLAKGPFPELDLYDEAVERIAPQQAILLAKRVEKAAFGFDARIQNSDGATLGRSLGHSAVVLSSGFVGTKCGTQVSLGVTPVIEDSDQKRRRGHYYSLARHLVDLEDAELIGQEAAKRTVGQLGARPVKTCEAPILFSPDAARSIISAFTGCALGGAIWRKASYLCGREGTLVASPLLTLIDDPLLPRGFGSRTFDGEGLVCRKNTVVDRGSYVGPLLDCLSARKLNRTSTGSATRQGGSLFASTSNLVMSPGNQTEDEIIANTPQGLYVTDMMGFGFNAVTGDFSRGASGFWIEQGTKAYPVSEVTISSNLDKMLKGIDAVATMQKIRSSLIVPAFRLEAMTVAGC